MIVMHRNGGLSPELSTIPHFSITIYHWGVVSKPSYFIALISKNPSKIGVFED